VTKISAYLPGFDEKSPLARQTDAENQRDSWLRQMELAQLSEMSQAGAANASGANANKTAPSASWRAILQPHTADIKDGQTASASPLHHSSHAVVQTGDQGAASINVQADTASEHAVANDTATQIQGARPVTRPQTTPIASAANAYTQTLPQAAAIRSDVPAAQPAAVADAIPAPQAAAAMPAPQTGMKQAVAASSVEPDRASDQAATRLQSPANRETEDGAGNAPGKRDMPGILPLIYGVAAIAGMRANAAQAISVQQSADTPAIQTTPLRAAALSPVLMPDGDQQETMAAVEEAKQDQAPSADAPLEEKPIWQKRLMHMTGEGEDVKLWIRDHQLDTAQSRNLVYRLAGDIAGMGMRLKDATINGKLAFRSGDDDFAASGPGNRSRARRSAAVSNQGPDTRPAIDSINPATEEEHGT